MHFRRNKYSISLATKHNLEIFSEFKENKAAKLGGSPVFAPPTDWPVSYELK